MWSANNSERGRLKYFQVRDHLAQHAARVLLPLLTHPSWLARGRRLWKVRTTAGPTATLSRHTDICIVSLEAFLGAAWPSYGAQPPEGPVFHYPSKAAS